jgi:hypothetical protein
MEATLGSLINLVDDIKTKLSDGEYLILCNTINDINKLYKETKYECKYHEDDEDDEPFSSCICTSDAFNCQSYLQSSCRNFNILAKYCPMIVKYFCPDLPKIKLTDMVNCSPILDLNIGKCVKYLIMLYDVSTPIETRFVCTFGSIITYVLNGINGQTPQMLRMIIDKCEHIISKSSTLDEIKRLIDEYFDNTYEDFVRIVSSWRNKIGEQLITSEMNNMCNF